MTDLDPLASGRHPLTDAECRALGTDTPCPKCGARLQRVPAGRGCHIGPDCTHACPECGWHWTETDG